MCVTNANSRMILNLLKIDIAHEIGKKPEPINSSDLKDGYKNGFSDSALGSLPCQTCYVEEDSRQLSVILS